MGARDRVLPIGGQMSTTLKCDDGDLLIDNRGQFIPINGMQKAAQDIAESLLNNWDPEDDQWWNGSELFKIERSPSEYAIVGPEEQIRYMVEDAVTRLQDLQEEDAYADDDELIAEIRELWVKPLGDMTYGYYLVAITASEEKVDPAFKIDLNQQLPSSMDAIDLYNLVTETGQLQPFA